MLDAQVESKLEYARSEINHIGRILRITREEWNEAIDSGWLGYDWESGSAIQNGMRVFYYPGFTLYQDKEIVGNWIIEGYGGGVVWADVIHICLPFKRCEHKNCSRHKVFGPYKLGKNENLARDNALKFLVEHNLVEIVGGGEA